MDDVKDLWRPGGAVWLRVAPGFISFVTPSSVTSVRTFKTWSLTSRSKIGRRPRCRNSDQETLESRELSLPTLPVVSVTKILERKISRCTFDLKNVNN